MEDNFNDPSSKRIKQKIQTYLKIRHPANHPVLLLYSCQDPGCYSRVSTIAFAGVILIISYSPDIYIILSCYSSGALLFSARVKYRKNPMFRMIPTVVDTGAARPIFVRLASGWILI